VASGGKALGTVDVDAGDVLYAALEDTGRRLQDRMGKILAGQPAPRRLRLELEMPTFSAGGRDRLAGWLEQHPGARLVVVDVLARQRDPVTPGQQYEADYASVAGFKDLADHYGVAVVLVHHVRKAAADDFLDAVSGTNGLAGAADSVLVLQRARGRADGLLRLTGRDVEEQEHALRWTPALGLWGLLPGPAVDHTVGETRAALLQYLRARGSARPKELADVLQLEPVTVRVTLSRMVEDGQLDRDGRGRYQVAGDHVDEVDTVDDLDEVDPVDQVDDHADQLLDLDAYNSDTDYGRFTR
jgi:AAA domain